MISAAFIELELKMAAAKVEREKREAEEKAKADAVAAAAEMSRKVEQLASTVARQEQWLQNLTDIVGALRSRAVRPRPNRRAKVSEPAGSCPLDAALEAGSYE